MASIIREIQLDAPADTVWDAVRDFDAVDRRLVPGFVIDCRADGDGARVVTFFNGAVAREILVSVDDREHRLAYSVVESALGATHHNASAQVFGDGNGGSRIVWITDVLPDELAFPIGDLMARGADAMRQALVAR
jgi:carbon monoxide dehydrogenase subunit G